MRRTGPLVKGGTLMFIIPMVLLATAAGVLVRDVGSAYRVDSSGPIEPLQARVMVFNAYQLTYTLAVFATVQVSAFVEAVFVDWRLDLGTSEGVLIAHFKPQLPGVHRLVVTNLENRTGQLGLTLEQYSDVPPELEGSILIPLLGAAGALLTVWAVLTLVSRSRRPVEERPDR